MNKLVIPIIVLLLTVAIASGATVNLDSKITVSFDLGVNITPSGPTFVASLRNRTTSGIGVDYVEGSISSDKKSFDLVPTEQIGTGSYTLTIRALGVNGVWGTDEQDSFTVSEPKMIEISLRDLVDDEFIYKEELSYYIAAYDNNSPISKFELNLYDEDDELIKSRTITNIQSVTIDLDDILDCIQDDDGINDTDKREECYEEEGVIDKQAEDIEDCLTSDNFFTETDEDDQEDIAEECINESMDIDYSKIYYAVDDEFEFDNDEENTSYYIKVSAFNTLGLESSVAESEEFTFDLTKTPASCSNELKDQDETDVDCGGSSCDPCTKGKSCIANSDCQENNCNSSSQCEGASCNDGSKNGGESDIDCGGSCNDCPDGDDCNKDADCISRNCVSGTCEEQEDTCNNYRLDPDETDIDCGGKCPRCSIGKDCVTNNDCVLTAECTNNLCTIRSVDTDNDGIDDTQDNCKNNPNPDQADSDNDGKGDACDSDSDNDGIPDSYERQYFDCDTCVDPNQDFDGDGLSNNEEYQSNTNPTKADTDGDGVNDREELYEGSDPLDPGSKPGSESSSDGFPLWLIFLILLLLLGGGAAAYFLLAKKKEDEDLFSSTDNKPKTQASGLIPPPNKQTPTLPNQQPKPKMPSPKPIVTSKKPPISKTKKPISLKKSSKRSGLLSAFGGSKPEVKEQKPKEEVKIEKKQTKKETPSKSQHEVEEKITITKKRKTTKHKKRKEDVFSRLKKIAQKEKSTGENIDRVEEQIKKIKSKLKKISK